MTMAVERPIEAGGVCGAVAAGTSPRLLIVKLSSLGDLFHALPAVHDLKTGMGASVDWVTQEEYGPLVGCFQDVERVIGFPRHGGVADLLRFRRELRCRTYDWVIDLQGLLKSGLVAGLARSRRRLGPSFHREGASVFYTAVAGPRDRARHAVEESRDAVRFFGLPAAGAEVPVRFPARPVREPRPRVALVPVTRWASKNWPVARYAEVGRRLQKEHGASLFCLGGAGAEETTVCKALCAEWGAGAVNLAGRTSLVDTGSVMKEMDLVIGGDSGPVHMAAALGIPVVALFGPTDPRRTGPYGPGPCRVVTADEGCRSCHERTCRKPPSCMERIRVDAVMTGIRDMVGRRA